MKKMTNILAILLLFLSLTAFSPDTEPYIIVRVIECQGGDTANESMILIDRGDNQIEKVKLEKFHKNNFEANFKVISKQLNAIKSEGYRIISTSGGGGNDNAMILQNYIFEKV